MVSGTTVTSFSLLTLAVDLRNDRMMELLAQLRACYL